MGLYNSQKLTKKIKLSMKTFVYFQFNVTNFEKNDIIIRRNFELLGIFARLMYTPASQCLILLIYDKKSNK